MLATAFVPARAALTLALAAYLAVGASAQSCDSVMTIETAGMAEPIINAEMKTGKSDPCPAETMYWEHPPSVYGGYKGCVGENGLVPCANNGFEGMSAATSRNKKYTFDEATGKCVDTGKTIADEKLWILWGHPMDKKELVARTGQEPVVTFPLARQPYPSYFADGGHGDDAADLGPKLKEFQEYLGAFTKDELTKFEVMPTEGAEQGMIGLFAYMALKIAMTTCNRDIYHFVESPNYGYDNGESARLVNMFGSKFALGCPNETSPEVRNTPFRKFQKGDVKPVTITTVGWAPGQPLPVRMGGDGKNYTVDSTSPQSPWFESLVFPENPTGTIKKVKVPDAGRRVCDGVYLYPTYFGHPDASGVPTYKIPAADKPDCDAWAFSITKIYSAAVRGGTVMIKNDGSDYMVQKIENGEIVMKPANAKYPTYSLYAASEIFKEQVTKMRNGLYSEWMWWGQIQIMDIVMEKPLSDPTSWVTAYSALMKEKWEAIIDGFKDCPVVELTNGHKGAYGFFKFLPPYIGGLGNTGGHAWFDKVLGVSTTSYNWGWRSGSDPAAYYGEGYTFMDFQRMQLYRDLSVYKEVGRRAKIVCSGGKLPGLNSTDEWMAELDAKSGSRRALVEAHKEMAEDVHKAHANRNKYSEFIQDVIAKTKHFEDECGPHFDMDCVMEYMGRHGSDVPLETTTKA